MQSIILALLLSLFVVSCQVVEVRDDGNEGHHGDDEIHNVEKPSQI